ncbi:MAG: hypothetical protein LBN01_02090 [Endomicrobium sp.]|jgi:hypothetical protein|nr:hypothetical protein [Endomicrobium sp.]
MIDFSVIDRELNASNNVVNSMKLTSKHEVKKNNNAMKLQTEDKKWNCF